MKFKTMRYYFHLDLQPLIYNFLLLFILITFYSVYIYQETKRFFNKVTQFDFALCFDFKQTKVLRLEILLKPGIAC